MAHTDGRPTDAALSAFERGNAAFDRGDWSAAEAAYREVLARHPDYALARYNYGLLLLTTRRPQEAEHELRAVVAADPAFAEARVNLGAALNQQRRYADADEQFRAAVALGCALPELDLNRATTLTELGQFAEAATLLGPLTTRPDFRTDALVQLALVRLLEGRPEEAAELYRALQRLGVRSADVRSNLGVALLAAGRWAEGWIEYEARLEIDPNRQLPPGRLWSGENPAGRTILLDSEQGLGDLIQFVRFAEPLAARGATVWLRCPAAAEELMATQKGIARVVRPPFPAFDYFLPLLSLPRLLGTTRENLPAGVPYLHADSQRRAFWRARLPRPGTLRVGVVWRGSGGFSRNYWRSIDLGELAPLFHVAGVTFVSLQKGLGLDELARLGPTLGLHDLGPEYQAGSLADTAALVAELDLVISVDTSVAHLAGAMGRPCWVALSQPLDWRWERGTRTSRWYPSARLYRQRTLGQWESEIEEMRRDLERHRDECAGRV